MPGEKTLGELAGEAVSWSRLEQGETESTVDEEAVYEQLRDSIVDIAGVERGAITPEARFVHDLGMD